MLNCYKEDTHGAKGLSRSMLQSIDSLFNPEICLSTHKPTKEDYNITSTAKKLPKKDTRSLRETLRNQDFESSMIDIHDKYYISKPQRVSFDKESSQSKVKRYSESLMASKENVLIPKKKKKNTDPHKGEEKLHAKIHGLKGLIKCQQDVLKGLKKKVSSDKYELGNLLKKLDESQLKPKKKSTRDSAKKSKLNQSTLAYLDGKRGTDFSDIFTSVRIQDRSLGESMNFLRRRSSLLLEGEKSFTKGKCGLPKYGQSMLEERDVLEIKDLEEDRVKRRKEEKDGAYNQHMTVLEDSIKELKDKYEEEICELKKHLEEVRNENLKLKEASSYDKGCERVQILQSKRLKDLIEALGVKERELAEKDKYYNEQLESMGMKVMGLNDQMERAGEYQRKVKGLSDKINQRNEEIEAVKKYFLGKLENNSLEQEIQKKEWEDLHCDLMGELKILKGRISPMSSNVRSTSSYKGNVRKY